MPWEHTIDPKLNLCRVKASGVITTEDLTAGFRRAHADPLFHPALNAFADYSEVTGWRVPADALRHLAASRPLSGKSRTAIWTTTPLTFGMIRAYQAWVDAGVVRVFTDRAEAWAWATEDRAPTK